MAKRQGTRTQRYRSKYEAVVAADLEERGVTFEYEGTKLPYSVPGLYTSDFRLPHGVIVECKGYFPAMDRRKILRVIAENPWIDLRLLFQRASVKLSSRPASKTYGQWATHHGIPWAEGTVPPEWILDGTG